MKKFGAMLCALVMVVSFACCGAEKGPEQPVEKFCEALQEYDLEAASSYTVWEGDGEDVDLTEEVPAEFNRLIKRTCKKIKFEIEDSGQFENDSGYVYVMFSYPDYTDALIAAMEEGETLLPALEDSFVDDEELMQMQMELLMEKIEETETPDTILRIEFGCVKTDDGWKIDDVGNGLRDIITGDLIWALEMLGY